MQNNQAAAKAMSKPYSGEVPSVRSCARSELDEHETIGRQTSRLITKAELCRIVPYTPQHILRLEKRGMFPRRIQVGANRVAWLLSEIEEWVAVRLAARDRLIR